MGSSNLALLISLASASIYGYSAYFMLYKVDSQAIKEIPKELHKYGQLKYLTFLTLMVQLFTYILHILAHFIRPLEGLRDLVFTTLAVPLASIVCYTFWGVWHSMGREFIMPERMDAFIPPWLNHSIHTIIVPVNMIVAFLIHHRYYKNGVLITLLFTASYTAWLHYIKAQTGHFVYKYLEVYDDRTRMMYFAGTGLFTYLMYKFGQFLTFAIHGRKPNESVRSSVQKKKQK